MRIISGIARGLKLVCPEGLHTRPTLDRVKEAVFSFLLAYIYDSCVLDLFAGSGALGIEALSRGALKSVFVDNDAEAIKCIKKNLAYGKFSDNFDVFFSTADDFLKTTSEKFDIIFLDPPYEGNLYDATLELIDKYNVLSDNGIIVVEWDKEIGFINKNNHFVVLKEKHYGRVGITVLVNK